MAEDTIDLRELVAEVAAAYFSNSNVNPNDIPQVIAQIASSLAAISDGSVAEEATESAPAAPKLTPGQIRKSIAPSALISFEDGRPYKTLRRHLTVKGLTPEAYREKWGLPRDYPLVAADYSASRSQLAKNLGLGRKGATARGRGGRAKKV